jgi:hypothetical protein
MMTFESYMILGPIAQEVGTRADTGFRRYNRAAGIGVYFGGWWLVVGGDS